MKWEDPPNEIGKKTKWYREAQELRKNPKRWALLIAKPKVTGDRTFNDLAGNISYGRLSAFSPAGSFQATTQIVDGEVRVYVRYVGDEDVA